MGTRSQVTRATYACGFDAFAICFKSPAANIPVAGIKANELDAYSTLDKFVFTFARAGSAHGSGRPRFVQ